MSDDLVYIRMITMMMETFNSLEEICRLLILKNLMDLFCLEDPLELKWPDENDSQKIKEILDANENVDDLSWLYGRYLLHVRLVFCVI